MKKSNFLWLFFLIPIYYFHSCAPSRNLQDPPMILEQLEQTLSSAGSLKNLANSSLAAGKVAQYTTHGGKNGLISLGDANGCVVMVNGRLKCWGLNANNQLGYMPGLGHISTDPDEFLILDPTLATAVNPKEGENDIIASVVMGRSSTCANYASGYKCWGKQDNGVLGNGITKGDALTPQHVTNAARLVLKSVQLNDGYSCVLDEGGKVTCWGKNDKGQLGNGNNVNSYSGTEVSLGGVAATQLVSHNLDSCVVLSKGEVKCWGGDFPNSAKLYTPVSITTTHPVKFLGGGTSPSPVLICAVLQDTTVECFGNSQNTRGGFGNGTFDTPSSSTKGQPVLKDDKTFLTDVTMVGSGVVKSQTSQSNIKVHTSFACAVVSNTSVYCWGGNSTGNLGNGTLDDSNVAVKVNQLWNHNLHPDLKIIDLAVSDGRACVLLKNDDVWCWGGGVYNSGELGIGGHNHRSSIPVKILNRTDH